MPSLTELYKSIYEKLNSIASEYADAQSRLTSSIQEDTVAKNKRIKKLEELLEKIKEKGVRIGFVTLHVGLGTFRPVKADNIEEHHMHSEHYHLPAETAAIINETKAGGGRVFAVGTTCCRTLESVATFRGCICEDDGWTDIFIYPGYEFKCIDCLITNFHLPESTLIMLVSAFAGYDHTMHAYEVAVKEKYRFFSFGDAMLIV